MEVGLVRKRAGFATKTVLSDRQTSAQRTRTNGQVTGHSGISDWCSVNLDEMPFVTGRDDSNSDRGETGERQGPLSRRANNVWIDTNCSSNSHERVVAGLVQYNTAIVGPENWAPIAVYARAEDGTVVGGLQGHTHWDWLSITQAWVEERHRGTGIGSRLLSAVEQLSKTRGCKHAMLDTFSFQAEHFYRRFGYETMFIVANYPGSHSRLFMRKELIVQE